MSCQGGVDDEKELNHKTIVFNLNGNRGEINVENYSVRYV